jgi:PAS domain S-box-containing protein
MIDHMSEEVVRAIIETMPAEITVIDANDEVIGWNKHEKRIFKRALTSMGLDFRQCHPAESLETVERIVREMKDRTRDVARFWLDLEVEPGQPKHKVLIEFYALRADDGRYLGCMEFTRDVEEIRQLAGQKRLLD